MPSPTGGSWVSRAVGACLALLAGAVALSFAVHLIESIAIPLLCIGGLVALLTAACAALWHRTRGW